MECVELPPAFSRWRRRRRRGGGLADRIDYNPVLSFRSYELNQRLCPVNREPHLYRRRRWGDNLYAGAGLDSASRPRGVADMGGQALLGRERPLRKSAGLGIALFISVEVGIALPPVCERGPK